MNACLGSVLFRLLDWSLYYVELQMSYMIWSSPANFYQRENIKWILIHTWWVFWANWDFCMRTRFEKFAKHLEFRIATAVEERKWAKSHGPTSHKCCSQYSQLSLLQNMVLSVLEEQRWPLVWPQVRWWGCSYTLTIKTIYLSRWRLVLTSILYSACATEDSSDVSALPCIAEMPQHFLNTPVLSLSGFQARRACAATLMGGDWFPWEKPFSAADNFPVMNSLSFPLSFLILFPKKIRNLIL